MDWETILTSTIIAAIVTGIIELFNLNNSNKATFVIKQREEWREKIRTIIDDIYKADPSNIGVSLTMLKTRINAYGKVEVDLSKTTEDDKRKFYLKDGDIIKKGDKIKMMSTGAVVEVVEVGVTTPKEKKKEFLTVGDVGWVAASIKDVLNVKMIIIKQALDWNVKNVIQVV